MTEEQWGGLRELIKAEATYAANANFNRNDCGEVVALYDFEATIKKLFVGEPS